MLRGVLDKERKKGGRGRVQFQKMLHKAGKAFGLGTVNSKLKKRQKKKIKGRKGITKKKRKKEGKDYCKPKTQNAPWALKKN